MSVRSVLSSEGLIKASFNDEFQTELQAQFEVALQDLLKKVELPGVKLSGAKNQKVAVDIPWGFESMWSELWIELRIQNSGQGLFGSLDWHYKHPGGGSNGVPIGRISVMADTLQAGWRLDTGEHKVFRIP